MIRKHSCDHNKNYGYNNNNYYYYNTNYYNYYCNENSK